MKIRRLLAVLAVPITMLLFAGPAQAYGIGVSHAYAGFYQAANASNSYEGVEMTFVDPVVDPGRCSPNIGLPTWVGMYGGNDIYPFIQAGVSLNDDNKLGAWYEIFDANGNTTTYTVPDWSAYATDTVTLRIVWGYGHQNVWFVWSDHDTTQYTAVKRYLPGYYPTQSVTPQYFVEDNYSGAYQDGHYWRIPWFGSMHVTEAKAEQTSSTTPSDSAGVPFREGVVKLDDSTVSTQMNMLNYSSNLIRVDETVPQAGAFTFNEHYCY